MEKCEFSHCVFKSSTFADAVFKDCIFINCVFQASSLHNALIYNVRFVGCSFRVSNFDSSIFVATKTELCEFDQVAAPGAYFCRSDFECSRFHMSDMREVYFYKARFNGVSFSYSDFDNAVFSSVKTVILNFKECSTIGCRALDMKTESPELLKAMNTTLSIRLAQRERLRKKGQGFGSLDQYERGLVYKAVKRWFAYKDIQRAHARFAENNARRLLWAESRMDSRGRDFLAVLPALLHSGAFERYKGIEDMCVPSRISGYSLTTEDIRALDEMFKGIDFDDDDDLAVPVKALMSIGSTGTIAQSSSSDLDCWVCCDFSKVRGDSRERLQFKLGALEDWAESEFGLEVHFFVMDVREVRDNKFGISDEESSGSAQSAILKEEFYRTALLISGRPPLWWFSPVDADDREYAETAKRVSLLCGNDYAVDLGNVPHIPMEEFFGASLWQIVKGVKSPFKSIMKFGLLEMYTSGEKNPCSVRI